MTPELKDVSPIDWDGKSPIRKGSCIWFDLEIGDSTDSSADLFQIGACDAEWKDLNIGEPSRGFVLGDVHFAAEAILLLDSIELERVREAVKSVLNYLGPFGEWGEFGRAMKRIAVWEFDGMER